MTKLSSLAF